MQLPLAKPGTQLFLPKCALGKLLVHLLMCLLGISSCAVESVILLVAVAAARYEYQLLLGAESACGVYARGDNRL